MEFCNNNLPNHVNDGDLDMDFVFTQGDGDIDPMTQDDCDYGDLDADLDDSNDYLNKSDESRPDNCEEFLEESQTPTRISENGDTTAIDNEENHESEVQSRETEEEGLRLEETVIEKKETTEKLEETRKDVIENKKKKAISPITWDRSSESPKVTRNAPQRKENRRKDIRPHKSPVSKDGVSRDEKEKHFAMLKSLFRGARFFIIKSINHENVTLAKAKSVWSSPPPTEAKLDQAYRECRQVILIFSVMQSGHFQGFARLTGPVCMDHPRIRWVLPPGLGSATFRGVFKLNWIARRGLPFTDSDHLRNPWNMDKTIKFCRDGQEVEPHVGERLCKLFPVDRTIDLPALVEQARKENDRALSEHHKTRMPPPEKDRSHAATEDYASFRSHPVPFSDRHSRAYESASDRHERADNRRQAFDSHSRAEVPSTAVRRRERTPSTDEKPVAKKQKSNYEEMMAKFYEEKLENERYLSYYSSQGHRDNHANGTYSKDVRSLQDRIPMPPPPPPMAPLSHQYLYGHESRSRYEDRLMTSRDKSSLVDRSRDSHSLKTHVEHLRRYYSPPTLPQPSSGYAHTSRTTERLNERERTHEKRRTHEKEKHHMSQAQYDRVVEEFLRHTAATVSRCDGHVSSRSNGHVSLRSGGESSRSDRDHTDHNHDYYSHSR